MNQLNRWQRIAVVLSAVWFCAVSYYFGHDFPTEERVHQSITAQRIESRGTNMSERKKAFQQCDEQSGGDILKEFSSGCRLAASEKYTQDNQWTDRLYDGMLQTDLEELPKQQGIRILYLLLIGLLPPLLMYSSIVWIARAPTSSA